MKRTLLFVCVVLTLSFSSLSAKVFDKAEGQGTSVTWRTIDETGVKYFVVLRSEIRPGDQNAVWEQVGNAIEAKGSGNSYSVEDVGVFKAADRVFKYQIVARNASGVTLDVASYTTSYLTSAAKRTWGSIKAMFR